MTSEILGKTVRLIVLSAGLSAPSSTRVLADALSAAVTARISAAGARAEVTVVELRELALDVARVMVTGMPAAPVEEALDALEGADAVIAVTPVFAGSYSGVFKSFMDLVGTQRLQGTPVLLGATGGSVRHSLMLDHAMRPLFAAVRAQVAATAVFAAAEDFGGSAQLSSRVERAAEDLVRLLGLPAVAQSTQSTTTNPGGVSSPSAVSPESAVINSAAEFSQSDSAPDQSAAINSAAEFSQSDSAPDQSAAINPAAESPESAAKSVGKPGPKSVAALLKSDGTAGRLRPDFDDFMPMGDLLGEN